MARTTAAEVEKIIDADSNIDTDSFLSTANIIVTDRMAGAYSDDVLAEIEKYLTAHLMGMRVRQLMGEKFGDADQKYGGQFGTGLKFTQYGQQVMLFDQKGLLDTERGKSMIFQAL